MKNKYHLIVLLALCMHCVAVSAQITIVSALCDNRVAAVGVNPAALYFSWEMKSALTGDEQTAYQLVVSSSREALLAGNYDVANTGKVASARSIRVNYNGKPLAEGQQYFWKVRVWNKQAGPSAWTAPQSFITALHFPGGWKNAQWIGYEDMPDSMRVVPFVHGKMDAGDPRMVHNAPAPLLRKQFDLVKRPRRALLFISGLGHYEATINGKAVGNAFLAPGWTSYDKTILYNTLDVTDLLKNGSNTINVLLGNGFYNISQERYVKGTGTFGKPKMIAKLKLVYADGQLTELVTDESWQAALSATTFNNMYGGEDYDARLEQPNAGSGWRSARIVKTSKAVLLPEQDYPVVIADSLLPQKKVRINKHVTVYDFGQNLSGIPGITVKGKGGQRVRITPAELLNSDGTVNQGDGVTPHYYEYIVKGDGEESWRPRFSYFAVRYMQVECSAAEPGGSGDNLPVVSSLKLLHTRNASPSNGSFECSNKLFNNIFHLIDRAIRSNLQSYITDNPQREKLSWQGEQNFMRVPIHYNYHVYNLYRMLCRQLMDAQHTNGLVPDIAPEYMQFEGPFVDSPEWGTTAILSPWFLYKYYGDTAILRETYPMMKKYAAYLEGKSTGDLLLYGLGDWLDIGNLTPVGLTATAFYYHAVSTLATIAKLTGQQTDAVYYEQLSARIKKAFNTRFFDQPKKIYANGGQTAMAMPLSMGLVDDADRPAVLKNLVEHIKLVDSNRITAGDVGHLYLVKALYEAGVPEVLYTITNRDDVPGYGYILKRGATALTENWDGNQSQNQLAMGHIMEWFYAGIGGITQTEHSIAFKEIVIRPQPVGDLTWANTRFHCPYGWIVSYWKKSGNRFSLHVEVPVNTTARVYLPVGYSSVNLNNRPVQVSPAKDGNVMVKLGSGVYDVESR